MMQNTGFLREFAPAESGAILRAPAHDKNIGEEAHARGFAEGMAQARQEIDLDTLTALRDLSGRLSDMVGLRDAAVAKVSAEAGAVLATAIRSIAPDLAVAGVADRARQLLENQLRDAPRPLTVTVSPAVADRLKAITADMPDPDFTIEAVDTMPDTRIEAAWPEGGATVDADALVTRITEMAAELAPPAHPVEETPHD